MIVLVDLDAIVFDFFTPLLNTYNQQTNENVELSQINQWDMTKCVKNGILINSIFKQPGFFRNLKPLPGAVKSLEWINSVFDTVIVSYAVTPHSAQEKLEACEEWLPFIPRDNIIIGYRKELVKGDVLIDDGIHNALKYRQAFPKSQILSIAYPYNKPDPANNPFDLRSENYYDTLSAWMSILLRLHGIAFGTYE